MGIEHESWIPPRYRGGIPARHCSAENPYQGFCGLPKASGRRWYICQRCGSHWFTVPNHPEGWARARQWGRWERLETHIFKAACTGVRIQRQQEKERKINAEPNHMP